MSPRQHFDRRVERALCRAGAMARLRLWRTTRAVLVPLPPRWRTDTGKVSHNRSGRMVFNHWPKAATIGWTEPESIEDAYTRVPNHQSTRAPKDETLGPHGCAFRRA